MSAVHRDNKQHAQAKSDWATNFVKNWLSSLGIGLIQFTLQSKGPQLFVGFCNFYRFFIKDYSSIVLQVTWEARRHLNLLTKTVTLQPSMTSHWYLLHLRCKGGRSRGWMIVVRFIINTCNGIGNMC
ncbi:hypothetical protein PROFUN_11971 [Planoprotostelium fungivorum]|uniref:Uncharacterized protein n=1 Tax=Planoprotostelium fungivorum TaxID=1890364 RepID=A0A2P6N8U4_9EUKA|nr:hypothetical protein PROFUN_11971 [Planoprotostelium fungivorum]